MKDVNTVLESDATTVRSALTLTTFRSCTHHFSGVQRENKLERISLDQTRAKYDLPDELARKMRTGT